MKCSALWSLSDLCVACENIRFSSLFAAGDVSRETFPAAKSEEKRMFSQANNAAETNCGIAHILGIPLMNSYDT